MPTQTTSIRGVAVTGAAGFIGAHMVRAVRARGVPVLPLVRQRDADGPTEARAVAEAIHDPKLLRGIDVIVHAAAVRHRYGVGPGEYRASNVDLVERTMRASSAAGVRRFVLVSSVGVYGFPADLPITESHRFAPRTLYATTKVDAETLARRVAGELGIELVIARPTIVYGPGDRNGMLDKMAAMIRSGTYRVVGSGRNVLHHTHIDDLVAGLWLALAAPSARGEDFIFAGPETTTLAELSARVARAVGRPLPLWHVPLPLARAAATITLAAAHRRIAFGDREPPISHEKLDVMTVSVAFDPAKARRILGFAPAVGYEEGVRSAIAAAPRPAAFEASRRGYGA